MNALSNLSLRARIALPILILVFGVIATIGFTASALSRMADQTVELSEEKLPYIAHLSKAANAMNEAYLQERASLMMDVQSPDFSQVTASHKDALDTAAKVLASLSSSGNQNEGDMPMAEVQQAFEQWASVSRKVLELRSKDTRMSRLLAVDLSGGDSRKQFDDFKSIITSLTNNHLKATSSSVQFSLSDSRSTILMLAIVGSIVSLFGALVAWLLPRLIARRLTNIQQLVDDIAKGDGDLTRRLNIRGTDEIAQIGHSFDEFSAGLHDTIRQAKGVAEAVALSARELSDGNKSMAGQTEQQAGKVVEASASLAQVAELISSNSVSAQNAHDSAVSTRELAQSGGEVIRRAVLAMADINESSKQIGDIIGVVDSIAFQTNILALNAAVEAARAGEQGRGFAVVASEVRNLAQRSAAAANEVKGLIRNANDKVSLGAELVNASGDTLEKIMASVIGVTESFESISSAGLQQSNSIQDINSTISEIGDTMQVTTGFVEEVAASSSQLDEQSSELLQLISRFKVNTEGATG